VADELYTDIRESISGLRARVADRGLIPALRDYAEEFEERHGIAVSLRADRPPSELSTLAELQLFRIVQEALTNVRKHAGARSASISLAQTTQDAFEIVVADDGVGFSPPASVARARALGVAGMRERAESLGGTLEVESEPGSGARVVVRIPSAGGVPA
jgi:signal transduction histidine kinase